MTGLLPKPRFGDPCNGCGLCCIVEQCALSLAVCGKQEICPALVERDGGAFGCDMIANPKDYLAGLPGWCADAMGRAFALMLGAGIGCDADDHDMPAEEAEAIRLGGRARSREAVRAAPPEVRAIVEFLTTPEAT